MDGDAKRTVWNFAYGSNLNAEVRARRKLHASTITPAVLLGWRLAFNVRGVPLVEPAMAGIAPGAGEEVHGVLLELTPQQFAHLEFTEGAGRFYATVEMDVRTYDGGTVRSMAFVPVAACVTQERPPSSRYLELIRSGARQSGLNPDYCRKLERLPCASTRSIDRMLGSFVMDALMWSHDTPMYDPCHDYLALLHRVEASGGVLASAVGQGLLLTPLVALGIGARIGGRIAKLRGRSRSTTGRS